MDPELPDHRPYSCLCTNVSNNRRRRLVVAFDGTRKQFGSTNSHVVEFYSKIAKTRDQLSYYAVGIGAFIPPSSRARRPRIWLKSKWASMMAQHFKSNVLSGYRFLSDKYEVGDQIFLLGFSRGAYQARVLAAMIKKIGLLRTGNNELIPFAFNLYMDPKASSDRPTPRGGTTTIAREFKKVFCHDVNIHFVGVWDTVSSVGAFCNKYYPGAHLADNICFFRHALALDERRVKFLPEYVVAKKEDFVPGEFGRPRCREVWFRGYHSDVGGGRVENTTSDNGAIPCRWMVYEAMLAGLEMTPSWSGFKAEDLEPKIGKDPMTPLYQVLEYLPIQWEVHPKIRLPPSTNGEEHPSRSFSRAWHRKRPRQMLSHQKLHESIFLPDKLSGTPFARLPDEWIKEIEARREAIKLPRDQDKAAHTFVTIRLPSDPRIASETVRNTSHKSEASLSNGSLFKPEFTLPAEAVESNPIDYHEIPALIDGVVRGTNTRQYLECLEMLAYTDIGKETIQKINGDQFASMIRQICGDEMYARLATRLVSVGGMSGQLSESLPSPSAARTSPPRLPDLNFDSAPNLVDPAPTTGDKELTPAGRSEHARSDTGHCEPYESLELWA